MQDSLSASLPSEAPIPEEHALEMRRLAHDLANALEVIVQTSFLLGTTDLKDPAAEWHRMLETGVQKALSINMALRSYIQSNSPE